ncbi:hypothetical protein [Natrarchaeobaculum sulfurireducens]|uniref:Uncharacterized protein n=1 Tax=Natrarchaeobaculum sulfurireducens TaxID=2044521 RepID=A0A346PLW1_9EURY|nr:hypothetical protein [Natrarchaeobaculum sulfurireducens]AXR80506.1 hypothetical protein AArcMg_0483 [Natrarchaeobaculum sulfurireducens]
MRPFHGRTRHCKRCKCELEGGEEGCPQCGFNPRQTGLRVSMGLLLVVVVSMTVLTFPAAFWTGLEPFLLGLAVISFGLAVLLFLFSFLATPYRLSTVFAWF